MERRFLESEHGGYDGMGSHVVDGWRLSGTLLFLQDFGHSSVL
jgi:hypothetical protein